jgi:hypothetical protein
VEKRLGSLSTTFNLFILSYLFSIVPTEKEGILSLSLSLREIERV